MTLQARNSYSRYLEDTNGRSGLPSITSSPGTTLEGPPPTPRPSSQETQHENKHSGRQSGTSNTSSRNTGRSRRMRRSKQNKENQRTDLAERRSVPRSSSVVNPRHKPKQEVAPIPAPKISFSFMKPFNRQDRAGNGLSVRSAAYRATVRMPAMPAVGSCIESEVETSYCEEEVDGGVFPVAGSMAEVMDIEQPAVKSKSFKKREKTRKKYLKTDVAKVNATLGLPAPQRSDEVKQSDQNQFNQAMDGTVMYNNGHHFLNKRKKYCFGISLMIFIVVGIIASMSASALSSSDTETDFQDPLQENSNLPDELITVPTESPTLAPTIYPTLAPTEDSFSFFPLAL